MKAKTCFLLVLLLTLAVLLSMAAVTVWVDPYFHYHGPREGLAYVLEKERYQNDGIVRNFSYDGLISGTSMCGNFKTSEFDELFGLRSVKAMFSGGSFREVGDNLRRALAANGDLRYIVRSLDYSYLVRDKDYFRYDDYPSYLYDDELLNDVSYVLDKNALLDSLEVLRRTREGKSMTTFDWYGSFDYSTGTMPLSYFGQRAGTEGVRYEDCGGLSPEWQEKIRQNVEQNVASLAREYPEVQFYLFFPPCSIYYWDQELQYGSLREDVEAIRIAVEILAPIENVHLFSYADCEELILNLDDYSELAHYSADTNSRLLGWMREGVGEIPSDGGAAYGEALEAFFRDFDFDGLFVR